MSRLIELQNELEIAAIEEERLWDEIENAVADLPLCELAWEPAALENWNMELHRLCCRQIRLRDQIMAEQARERRIAKYGRIPVAIAEKAIPFWDWIRWNFVW